MDADGLEERATAVAASMGMEHEMTAEAFYQLGMHRYRFSAARTPSLSCSLANVARRRARRRAQRRNDDAIAAFKTAQRVYEHAYPVQHACM
jgi:hypothetical protein